MDLALHDEYLKNRYKVDEEMPIIEVDEGEDYPSITLNEFINRLVELKEKTNESDFESGSSRFLICDNGLFLIYERWQTPEEYIRSKEMSEELRKFRRERLKRDMTLNFHSACELIEEIKKEKGIC